MVNAELVERCSPRFRGLAQCFRLPRHDVDDLIQDMWLRILEEHGGRVALAEDALAEIEQGFRNAGRSRWRRVRRWGAVVTLLDDQALSDARPNPEESVMARQRSDILWSWLKALDEPLRVVIIERELLGMTFVQIAKAHGLPESTVKTRYDLAWSKVEQQKAQWQAKQRARGQATVPFFVPLFLHDGLGEALRRLRRIGRHASVSAAIILGMGSFPSAGGADGCSAAPWVSHASPVALSVPENPSSVAEERSVTPKGQLDLLNVQDSAPKIAATLQDRLIAPSAELATGTASPENRSDPPHAIESMLLTRAKAMVNLRTLEGQLLACRLLNQHREQYGRGSLARERDALFRQVRCERDTLTDMRPVEQ